jgi:hypothetical protein
VCVCVCGGGGGGGGGEAIIEKRENLWICEKKLK